MMPSLIETTARIFEGLGTQHGRVMVVDLGANVAEVSLTDRGASQGTYVAVLVSIASRRNPGQRHERLFRFSDYLAGVKRVDNRPDHRGGFYVWTNGGSADWYIAVPHPSAVAEMRAEILRYVYTYRQPVE
jgi:hypothetical protein